MHSIIFSLPVLALTAYAAWTDYKRKEIDNWIPAVVLTYGIILNIFIYPTRFTESITYTLTVFAILFTIYIITAGKLGGGDIKLLTALAFFFGSNIMFLLFVAGLTAGIYGILKGIKDKTYLKTETIFGPSIFIATVLTSILLF
jgi:Flp pilus assembly protein protease CpaA